MRRIALSLVFAIVVLACAAETHYVPHISVGVHGGMAMSEVSFTPSVHQRWLSGPAFGVQVRYAEERLVGIVAELDYEQRGWREDYSDNTTKSPLDYKRSLHYVSLPVMTHIYFGSRRCKCFFNLGPQFSLLLGQKTWANYDYTNPFGADGWPEEGRMIEQLTKQVDNKFDYGICGGMGFEFYTSPRNSVYIEGRYYFGLGNIFPATKADTFSASRNMSLTVTLGYNFRLR